MKSNILLLVLTVLFSGMSWGQGHYIHTYGTRTDRDHFYDVVETQDGNYLFVGTTRADVGLANNGNDGLLMKTDASGKLLWSVRRGHSSRADYFYGVWEDDLSGDLFVFGSQTQTGAKEHMILFKFDQWGNQMWERRMGGMSVSRFDEQGHGISGDQNYIYLFGTAYDVLPGRDGDGYIQVFDKSGNHVWSRAYGGNGGEHVRDGLYSTRQQLLLAPGMTNSVGAGDFEAMVVIIDPNTPQNPLVPSNWFNIFAFGTSALERAETIMEHSSGQIVLGGFRKVNGQNDILLISTDIAGNLNWARTYSTLGGGSELCYSLTELPNGNIACVGRMRTHPRADDDAFFLEVTPSGSMAFGAAYLFGGTGNETFFTSMLTSDNSLVMGGWSNSPTYTSGFDDCLAIKIPGSKVLDYCPIRYERLLETDLTPTMRVTPFGRTRVSYLAQASNTRTLPMIQEERVICEERREERERLARDTHSFSLFPNPASHHLILSLPENDFVSTYCHIYDMTGKKVNTLSISSDVMTIQIPVNNLLSGIYMLSVEAAGEMIWQQKWVKK